MIQFKKQIWFLNIHLQKKYYIRFYTINFFHNLYESFESPHYESLYTRETFLENQF